MTQYPFFEVYDKEDNLVLSTTSRDDALSHATPTDTIYHFMNELSNEIIERGNHA